MSTKKPLPINRIGHFYDPPLDQSGPTWQDLLLHDPEMEILDSRRELKLRVGALTFWCLYLMLLGSLIGGMLLSVWFLGDF